MTAKKVVYLQMSGSDQAKGRVGTRSWHWVKDQNAEPTTLKHGEDDLVVLVDVDYHIDMNELLSIHPASYLLYTMQPTAAGRDTGEYKYTFLSNGEVSYHVSGGAHYQHKVWDWGGDSLSVSTSWCCFPRNYTGYSVERRRVDEDHQLILLTPYKRYTFLSSLLARKMLHGRELQRMDPVDGSFARVCVNTTDGMTMSTGMLGGYLSANVPAAVDEAIILAASTSREFTRSMAVSKMVGPGGSPKDAKGSEVYVAYIREKQQKLVGFTTRAQLVSQVSSIRSYQYVADYCLYEPAKAAMKQFMGPLLNAGFVADRSRNNDERTVDHRVKGLQKDAAPPTPFVVSVMKEFAALLLECVGKLHPVDYDTVYEKQNRPMQRRILELAENEVDDGTATAMQKAEAYSSPNDPRNITVMNGPSKREHSKWMYALYVAMKGVPWYAFGKLPVTVAKQMAELCQLAVSHWLDTDLSRQDGRVNSVARMLEHIVMTALFHPDYLPELLRSMKAQTFLNVKTRFGVRYNSKFSRASGSAETSVFNTILTAFIFFLAWRMTINPYTGTYFTAGEAWEKLGLYGGDDGGTPDAVPQKVEKAAKIMGQVVKCTVIPRGSLGVQFLARRYGPGVWEGDANSCCDIVRQLSKFHLCTHLNQVTEIGKLCEKSYAFSLCDSETPIIGPFVSKVLEITNFGADDFRNALSIWNAKYSKEVHYPNVYADWMEDIVTEELVDWKQNLFQDWLNACTRVEDLMTPPVCHEWRQPDGKAGLLVVDGEFQGQRPDTIPKPAEAKRKIHRKRATNQFRGTNPNGRDKADPSKANRRGRKRD